MKLKKLELRNFRGLSYVKFEFDQPANVIVGPNAIGKTTVLEGVRLAKALLMPRYYQEAQQVLTSLGAMSQHPQLASYMDLASLARDPNQPIGIQLDLELNADEVTYLKNNLGQAALHLVRGQMARNDEQSQLAFTQFLSTDKGKEKLDSTTQDLTAQLANVSAPHTINIKVEIDPKTGKISADQAIGQSLVAVLEKGCAPNVALFSYFPADRAFPSGEANIQIGSQDATHQIQAHIGNASLKYQRLKQTIINNLLISGVNQAPLQEDFSQVLNKLLPGKELAGLSLSPIGKLNVSIREIATQKIFDIDSMSSGEKGLILTFMLLRRSMAKGGIALIDEPELHLNPAVCRNIIPFLCETIVEELGVQLIICTHSAEILGSAFERTDCTVHHLRSHCDATKIYERDDDEVFEALHRLGTSAADTLFSKGTIFVEGDDDEAVLEEGFFEQLSGYRVTGLGGRGQVEKEIRALQKAETDGELDRLTCFIFDHDRKPSGLVSSRFVKVLQWDRYCLENYLLDRKILFDELYERSVADLGSRGEFEARLAQIAQSQLREAVAREVFVGLSQIDVGIRAADVCKDTYPEVAECAANRFEAAKQTLDQFDKAAWVTDFISRCEAKHAELEQSWKDDWISLASGKRVIDDLYQSYQIRVSKYELKKSLIRRMKAAQTEEWTLVKSKIADALAGA